MANSTKRTMRIDDELYDDINTVAEKEHTTTVDIVDRALRTFRDAHYMAEKSYVIPQEVLKAVRAEIALSETRSSNRINKLLSELAISNYIISKVIASGLDVNDGMLEKYRVEAVEYLQINQRIFNLSDFL